MAVLRRLSVASRSFGGCSAMTSQLVSVDDGLRSVSRGTYKPEGMEVARFAGHSSNLGDLLSARCRLRLVR